MKIALSKKEREIDPKELGLSFMPEKGKLKLFIEKGIYVGNEGVGKYKSCLLRYVENETSKN